MRMNDERQATANTGREAVLYVHGQGGNAAEGEHYGPLFPGRDVVGLAYRGSTPWEAGAEIRAETEGLARRYGGILLVANSIGAFFSMHAGIGPYVRRAYFISPVVDMESLIAGMMRAAGVSEAELAEKGTVRTPSGGELSWEYLRYVRDHPIRWEAPTRILYGSRDSLTAPGTIRRFAAAHRAVLTVMEGGEHWFHTEEQMRFLDGWIRRGEEAEGSVVDQA